MKNTAEQFYDDNLKNYNLLNLIDPATAKQVMQMMGNYHESKLKNLGGIGDVRTSFPSDNEIEQEVSNGISMIPNDLNKFYAEKSAMNIVRWLKNKVRRNES